MGTSTRIVWADSTASPWTGCTPVSAGCDGCYARTLALRWGWCKEWGACAPRHRFAGFEKAALAMERKAAAAGGVCVDCGGYVSGGDCPCGQVGACGQLRRPRVFPSLCDWLDPEVPVEWLADLLDVIRRTPSLDWLLLTKRPERFDHRLMLAKDYHGEHGGSDDDTDALCGWVFDWIKARGVPRNVWVGTTVENQEAADERVPELLRIPAARRFVSAEPMLGPVTLTDRALARGWCGCGNCANRDSGFPCPQPVNGIDAVFCGGETGPKARPMHPDWVRSLRDQCVAAGVSFTFKQWGEWAPSVDAAMHGRDDRAVVGCTMMQRVGAKRAGRLLDGRTWDGKDVGEKAGPVGTCRGLSGDGKDGAK